MAGFRLSIRRPAIPDNFISGVDSSVKVGATLYQFKKWTLPVEGGARKFFAFGSNFQRTLPGGISATVSLEGAYDQGSMPLTIGTIYSLILGWDALTNIVVSARFNNAQFSTEIGQGGEPGGQLTATFESDGPFTIAFL